MIIYYIDNFLVWYKWLIGGLGYSYLLGIFLLNYLLVSWLFVYGFIMCFILMVGC